MNECRYTPWSPTVEEVFECFNPIEREHFEAMSREGVSFTLDVLGVKCIPMHAQAKRGGYRLDFRQSEVVVVYPCGHEGFTANRDTPEAVTEAFSFFLLRSSDKAAND